MKSARQVMLKTITISFIIMFCLAAPLSGEIRSVRTRNFGADDYTVQTTKYAKIEAGTIISKQMIQATIVNDPTPTYALVRLTIDMKTGDWAGSSVAVFFIEPLDANETFTFNNTELVSYLDRIQVDELDIDGISISSFEDFLTTGMPNGTYELIIDVYQVADDTLTEVPAGLPIKSLSNEFIVIVVEDLTFETLPTLNSKVIEWQLPMIPFYDAGSTSTSEITITGGGIDRTVSIDHDAPSTSASVDYDVNYPEGTAIDTDGAASYDLDDLNLPFRLGQQYSLTIEFNDWNGELISSQTRNFSFSDAVPAPRLGDPSGVIDGLQPTFSWTIGEYEDWVDHYDLYINGTRYASDINSDSYDAPEPLTPGSMYTWNVKPYYSDGTAFNTDMALGSKVFSTPEHNQLDISVSAPSVASGVLFTGTSYPFEAEATFYDGAEFDSGNWQIGSERPDGLDATYMPSSRGSISASVRVTDTFSLTTTAQAGAFTVKDPELSISSNKTEGYMGQPVIFTATAQDVDIIEWFIDGSSVYRGTNKQFTYEIMPGRVNITAKGFTDGLDGDWNPTAREIASETIEVTGAVQFPGGEAYFPLSPDPMRFVYPEGATVKLEIYATQQYDPSNFMESIEVFFDGTKVSGSNFMYTFPNLPPGFHEIEYVVYNILGESQSGKTEIFVYDASVEITAPEHDSMLGKTGNVRVTAEVSIADMSNSHRFFDQIVTSVKWYLGDSGSVAASGATASVNIAEPGDQTLRVDVELEDGTIISDEVEFEIAYDFLMTLKPDLDPTTEIREFEQIDFYTAIEFLSGSSVSVRDIDTSKISWYVNGSEQETGLDFTFDEGPGTYSVYAEYSRNGNTKKTQTRTVVVREPISPEIIKPDTTRVIIGEGQTITLEAKGESDADYIWYLVTGNARQGIARGNPVTIPTQNLPRAQQIEIEVVSSIDSWSETSEKKTYDTLILSPFQVRLNMPSTIFFGDTLTAEALLTGITESDENPLTYMFKLDGEIQDSSGSTFSKVIAANSGSMHTLQVTVSDSYGRSESASQIFTATAPWNITITNQNPENNPYVGMTAILEASLPPAAGNMPGVYTWTVTKPDSSKQSFGGAVQQFTFDTSGEYTFTVEFESSNGQVRANGTYTISVVPKPIMSLVTTPQKSIYNSDDTVRIRAVFAEVLSDKNIVYDWKLNGSIIQSGNENTMSIVMNRPGTTDEITCTAKTGTTSLASATLRLRTNSPPSGFSVNVFPNQTVLTDNEVQFSCTGAIDEQEPISYRWFVKLSGNDSFIPLNAWSQVPFFTTKTLPVGTHEVYVEIRDNLGASVTSTPVIVTVYPSVSAHTPAINNNNPLYVLSNSLPMSVDLDKDLIQMEWIVNQGDFSETLSGNSVQFLGSGKLQEGDFTVTFIYKSGDEEIRRGSYRLTAVTEANLFRAEIASPENGSQHPNSGSIDIQLALLGFSTPQFGILVDDESSGVSGSATLLPVSPDSQQRTYLLTITSETLKTPGLHTVTIVVTENEIRRELVLTVQVIEVVSGITLNPTPETLDQRLPDSSDWTVTATVQGINYHSLSWESSRHTDPLGNGLEINLSAHLTEPGPYTIYCKAFDDAGQLLGSTSFSITVLGEMSLASTPDMETGVYNNSSTDTISVAITNRDGTPLDEAQITWLSNIDGIVATGSILTPGTNLSSGTHTVTVIGESLDGDYISRIYMITVNHTLLVPLNSNTPNIPLLDARNIFDLLNNAPPQPVAVAIILDFVQPVTIQQPSNPNRDIDPTSGMFLFDQSTFDISGNGSLKLFITAGRQNKIIDLEPGSYIWDVDFESWEEE